MGRSEVVDYMMQLAGPPAWAGEDGRTALYWAAAEGHLKVSGGKRP
jgi:hypothetical protein